MPLTADPSSDGVPELAGVVRRVIRARVADPHDVDDLVQDTLVKVTAAEPRLEADALQGYAIVTAQNVVIGRARRDGTKRRHLHRLVDGSPSAGPEELTLQREESDALALALSRLGERDRDMLLAHEVDGVDTATLARDVDASPNNVAARLARARARLRLEFLLAFRGVTLTDARCRAVLLALSSGDQRRQRALHAGDHLVSCTTCAALSPPLVERRRSIAGLIPLLGFSGAAKAIRTAARSGKVQAAAAASSVAVGVVAVAVLAQPAEPARPTPRPAAVTPAAAPLMSGAVPLLPLPAAGLAPLVGRPVQARAVTVLAVPADEGVWVGTSDAQRVWLRFVGPGESPFRVTPGQHLTFDGTLVANPVDFAAATGLPAPDSLVATAQGAHIEAPYAAIQIT